MNYKIENIKIRESLLLLFLALGNVSWFAGFSLGILKACLLILIFLFHGSIFFRKSTYVYKEIFLFIILLITITILTTPNNTDIFNTYYGFFENYCFLVLGYYYAKNGLISISFVKKLVYLILPFCLLSISNFLFNTPEWHAPKVLARYDELIEQFHYIELTPLYVSGFGLGRTGWSVTLCQFLPLCIVFFIDKNNIKKTSITYFIIIFVTIAITGSRGGLLSASILSLIIISKSQIKRKGIILSSLLIIIISFLIIYGDSLSLFYRLDRADITTGRSEQYIYIPEMVKQAGFFGVGTNGTYALLSKHGVEEALHNTYFKLMIEYGWIFGLLIWYIVLNTAYRIGKVMLKNRLKSIIVISSLVILCGFIAATTEPGAIFGSRGWWVLWWFFFGVFSYNYKIMIKNISQHNMSN